MKDLSCKFCGGGKFVRFPTWMECWYCGSEFEQPLPSKLETPQVVIQQSHLLPYNFGATYFVQSSIYENMNIPYYRENIYKQQRYDYKLEQWVDV